MNIEPAPHRPRGQLDAADYLVIALALAGSVVVAVGAVVTVLVEQRADHPPTCHESGRRAADAWFMDRGTR